jgi:hypothetical protein
VDIAFRIKPALVWLVTFRRPGTDAPLFAVVLPDGEILDPRVLIADYYREHGTFNPP